MYKLDTTASSHIFVNNFKRHVCVVTNLRLGHDLPTSLNGSVISSFREGFIIAKLRACAKFSEYKTLVKISEFTVK